MILDKIENIDIYKCFGGRILRTIEYIQNNDLSTFSLGRHEIEGDDIFLLMQEYDTKDIVEGKMEAHRKYIDIQYMLRGTELFGYDILKKQVPTMEYSEERDVMFFGNEYSTLLQVDAGNFAIFYPSDIHMPGIMSGGKIKVLKAVFKIYID